MFRKRSAMTNLVDPRPNAPQEFPWLTGLNPPQREAVLTTEGPLLLLAGAGTGKTAALTARMAHILAMRLAWPSEILAVTFTNKAAREMKARIGKLVGEAVEGMPWLGTFHSIGAKMLRHHAPLAGLQSNFTILDTDDQIRLLKQLILSEEIDEKRFPAKQLAGLIDGWKNKGLGPAELQPGDSEAYANGKGQALYTLYQKRLLALNACDFGDLLLHSLNLLKHNRDILEKYQDRFKYILVDEYQDTNAVQYLWLRLLAQKRKNIACVGDDDQCLAVGSMVRMADGSELPIEKIQPGHIVLSCYGKGDFRPAKVLQTHQAQAERLTCIQLHSGRRIVSTAEHIHFADFIRSDSPQKYFTYLMVKHGVGYRLGSSQIYTNGQKKPVLGFKQRCLQEHADGVWLLRAFDRENDAREYEHLLSLRYGITTLPFIARKGGSKNGLVHDQERLDRLHLEIGNAANAQKLLDDHDLSADSPHHMPQSRSGKRRIFNLTLFAERRGATPMHRMSLSGNDAPGKAAIDQLGLSARVYKRNPDNWRFETLYRDMAKVAEIYQLLASHFDLTIRRKANLLGKPLALRRAADVRPGMVMACEDGSYDHVVAVEEAAGGAVYDLDIQTTHNFVANGIVTHNSIYSWRGAEVANILRFEKDFPGAKIIKLEQNYRSTPHILAAASGLIGSNRARLGKTLWTELNDGEKLRIIAVWDGAEEARRVGEEIEALQHRGGSDVSLSDIAILVRAQHQTREFEDRLIQIGLSYKIIGGFRFYERAEIRDAIAYLRIVNQGADDLAFERILNTPKRGIGGKGLEKIHILARNAGLPLSAAAAQMTGTDEMTGKARLSLAGLMANIHRWREQAQSLPPAQLARIILDESGYTDMLQAERSVESAGRLENLNELTRAMEEYDTLGAFLEHVSLVMDNDNQAGDAQVTIMTIHAAKGLEYRNLFLVGWEEGLFPSQRALDEGGLASLEEERRLAYVAITRAREKCTILHAANRRIYGQWTSSIPSRFIDELPLDHIEAEESMSGGASLWRANWSERADPFAHLAAANAVRAGQRGPGWQRAANSGGFGSGGFGSTAPDIRENSRSAASFAAKPRSDLAIGMRVFHEKFGYGEIIEIDGNKLDIEFDTAGSKRVIDSFVRLG